MRPHPASRSPDDGVSPVIGVILMVAVTVVLAAGVYVWISSQDARASGGPAALSVMADGGGASPGPGNHYRNLTLVAATPGLTYGQLVLTLDGVSLQAQLGACEPAATEAWTACAGGAARSASSVLAAGDTLTLRLSSPPVGATLRFIDPTSNSVVHAVVLG